MKHKSLLFIISIIPTLYLSAAVIGTDNASATAYDDGFGIADNGSITGNAFEAWTGTFGTDGLGGGAGAFVGDSTNLAFGNNGADINSGGETLALFSFGGAGNFIERERDFNGSLSVGQTFSIDLGVNFRSGQKGFDLHDTSNATLFNFNIGDLGSGDNYTVQSAATGNGPIGTTYDEDTAFNLSFTQTSLTGGSWTIIRSGGVTDLDTGTYSGVADGFKLYHSEGPGGSEQDLYFNNMAIIPEPGSLFLFGLAGIVLLTLRRRN